MESRKACRQGCSDELDKPYLIRNADCRALVCDQFRGQPGGLEEWCSIGAASFSMTVSDTRQHARAASRRTILPSNRKRDRNGDWPDCYGQRR